ICVTRASFKSAAFVLANATMIAPRRKNPSTPEPIKPGSLITNRRERKAEKLYPPRGGSIKLQSRVGRETAAANVRWLREYRCSTLSELPARLTLLLHPQSDEAQLPWFACCLAQTGCGCAHSAICGSCRSGREQRCRAESSIVNYRSRESQLRSFASTLSQLACSGYQKAGQYLEVEDYSRRQQTCR